MPKPSKFDSFIAQFKHRRSVHRPIAADVWAFTDASGKKQRAELSIGKPRRVPGEREWYCAVKVSTWMKHVFPAIGVGPLDSLDNAMKLARGFQEHVGDLHITRQSGSRARGRG